MCVANIFSAASSVKEMNFDGWEFELQIENSAHSEFRSHFKSLPYCANFAKILLFKANLGPNL